MGTAHHPEVWRNNAKIERFFYYVEDAFEYIKKIIPNITDDDLRLMECGETYIDNEENEWEIR